jgi:hypothetical protein
MIPTFCAIESRRAVSSAVRAIRSAKRAESCTASSSCTCSSSRSLRRPKNSTTMAISASAITAPEPSAHLSVGSPLMSGSLREKPAPLDFAARFFPPGSRFTWIKA